MNPPTRPQTIVTARKGASATELAGSVPLDLRAAADVRREIDALSVELAAFAGHDLPPEQLALDWQRKLHWKSLEKFLDRICRASLHETAVAIANEGRWFVACDRVSVLRADRGKCKVLAVSAVDRIEPRSSLVARMEELGAAVLNTNEALWETGQPALRAPQIEQPLQAFLDESHSRALVLLPLPCRALSAEVDAHSAVSDKCQECAPGVLVLEWFAATAIDDSARARIELMTHHGANAFAIALATDRLPFIAVNRALAKIGWLAQARQLPATLWSLGIVAALLLALAVVPADFEIAAEGELQPAERRELFAPADASVDSIFVEHGDDVVAGQPLLRLRSTALELENARLHGEIQTAERRLAAIRSARLERNADQDSPTHRYLQLTAEEEEIKVSLNSLRRQEQLQSQQRSELEIRSPFAGRVLTWDVARSLAARPVERGQSLLTVGSVAGRWSLELRVPDEHIGDVLAAAEQSRLDGVALPVSFLLVAEPGAEYRGEIERIARRSYMDEKLGASAVLVTVRLEEAIENPRPGAAAIGKIHCGRRSLGFVWLYDAWNSIRRRLLF